jgi:type I restriction enzyme R subunit
MRLSESVVEEAALTWFRELRYAVVNAPDLAPGEIATERSSFSDVVLVARLRDAIVRLNPAIPSDAREEALQKVIRLETPSLISNNRRFHQMLRDGVEVEYSREDGTIAGDHVRLIDFDNPDANDWLAVNQFTVIEDRNNRLPDFFR